MKILLVTEKHGPHETQRDGGAKVVNTLKEIFNKNISIMQFGSESDVSAHWHFPYPINLPDRFKRRLVNADFIINKIQTVVQNFTHVIFIHVSMQFGLVNSSLRNGTHVWTFPMFLTPSYIVSGETVPQEYTKTEKLTLTKSEKILTPSYLEKKQLMELYSVPEERIFVIPRGIETRHLHPKVRYLEKAPKFCSIGSIKPQKNTLGLIQLFKMLYEKFPGAELKIIGPIQNNNYYTKVISKINEYGLEHAIKLMGYVNPTKLSSAVKDSHIHISKSKCETFGRTIFETLALGLPNISSAAENAAKTFLEDAPYIRFLDDNNTILNEIDKMLANLSKLSLMAVEIGELYDDRMLSKLLAAEICNKPAIVISDFDGTLFHKDNHERTLRCIECFRNYPKKVICSARQLGDLQEKLQHYDITVDWIISCSGGVIADGQGNILWLTPLDPDNISKLQVLYPQAKIIEEQGRILQFAISTDTMLPNILGVRVERYEDGVFVFDWKASKLRAINRLMRYIDWSGRVCVFGDGPYDQESLIYYNGLVSYLK